MERKWRTHCIAFLLARLESSGFYLLGHLKTFVCAPSLDKEEALHHRFVDACQITCNYSSIFE
jgi:hypothetical protein